MIASVLALAAVLAAQSAIAQTTYQVTDLGVLPGGISSTATSIDNEDEVTGYTTFGNGSTEAFYWSAGNWDGAVGKCLERRDGC